MAARSSVLVWRIPWTEEPGGLQSRGSQSQTGLSAPAHTRLWVGGDGGGRNGGRAGLLKRVGGHPAEGVCEWVGRVLEMT